MGRLPQSPPEVRLGATLFLCLLGVADFFGAWQVKDFAAFTPRGVASTVAPAASHSMAMECCNVTAVEEKPVEPSSLNRPSHHIERDLLVQDTHVHVPIYALTAAFLALILFGLRLSSRLRVGLVVLAFAAPFLDFAGLWGAHLVPGRGTLFATLAVVGGFAMGLCYCVVLVLAVVQLWFPSKEKIHA